MSTPVRTPVAQAEMREALEYLQRRSPAAADRLSDQIEQAERVIGANPGMGIDRGNLRPGYRSVTVGQYQLFFRAADTEVIVLRFIHGSRDLPTAVNDDVT